MQELVFSLATPLIALVFASAFFVMWLRARPGAYMLAFALGYVGFGVGYLANHEFDLTSAWGFPFAHLAYTAGSAALVWGVCTRANTRPPMVSIAIIYTVCLPTLMLALSMTRDLSVPLYLVNSSYGLIFAIAALRLAEAPRREAVDKLILGIFLLSAIQFFVRPPLNLLAEADTMEAAAYRSSAYYSVLSLFISVLSVVTAMILLAACIQDMLRRAREVGERDHLSGLASRRSFEERAIALLDEAAASNTPVSLIVCDIDHFKRVNDIFGHQAGDAAIAAFGRLIADSVREGDVAGRIGGEEFCIAAWNCTAAAGLLMAERLRMALLDTGMEGMPADHRLTASFGVAQWQLGDSYGHIFGQADRALYEAKEGGRNRTVGAHRPEGANLVMVPRSGERQG